VDRAVYRRYGKARDDDRFGDDVRADSTAHHERPPSPLS
jgi:hypothetical protein